MQTKIDGTKETWNTEKNKIDDSYKDIIQKKDEKIAECEKQLNVTRDEFVKQQVDAINSLRKLINDWAEAVQNGNVEKTLCSTLAGNVKDSFEKFVQSYQTKVDDDFKKPDCTLAIVKLQCRKLLEDGLCRSGWISELAYLNCWSHIPMVGDVFNKKDMNTAGIGRIYSEILALLGAVDISLLTPNLLAETFNEDNCKYGDDGEVRITRLCEINPNDYPGKLFEMVQVGYTIVGTNEVHKPIVIYY